MGVTEKSEHWILKLSSPPRKSCTDQRRQNVSKGPSWNVVNSIIREFHFRLVSFRRRQANKFQRTSTNEDPNRHFVDCDVITWKLIPLFYFIFSHPFLQGVTTSGVDFSVATIGSLAVAFVAANIPYCINPRSKARCILSRQYPSLKHFKYLLGLKINPLGS